MGYPIAEACKKIGVERTFILHCIELHWIEPRAEQEFDEEDLARARLIRELKEDFGANDESIPIILHLLDQVYLLRNGISYLHKNKN
jgi:chaperone modulatory protein CbpM